MQKQKHFLKLGGEKNRAKYFPDLERRKLFFGKERERERRKEGRERKGKGRKGKERKGKERKGKERKGGRKK